MSSLLATQPVQQNFDLARSRAIAGPHPGDRSSHTAHQTEQGPASWFSGGLPTPPGTKDMTGVSLNNYGNLSQSQQYSNGYSNSQVTQPYKAHSRIPSESYSNTKRSATKSTTNYDVVPTEKNKPSSITSHLQIPESVNKSKGSLPEFAAEITCLFWFESAGTLEYAERLLADALPDRGLVPDATPTFGFKKWVTTILSTTQVGKNVILLALMFIYRLKKFNPSVSGKRGSEFRLLTIALMLGNKFLDDNTYTNKTWAEVSGISVTEIHIMEVEFLSNMRYELYASEADWAEWQLLLGKFAAFYEKASHYHLLQHDDQVSNPPITPTAQNFTYKLPSPPSGHLHPINTNYGTLPNPMTTLPHLPRSPVRQHLASVAPIERKRSLEASESLPPAKRLQYANTPSTALSQIRPSPAAYPDAGLLSTYIGAGGSSRVPQLPMPRLPPTTVAQGTNLTPLNLPSTRSMASVYPPTTAGTWSQPVTPISAIPPTLDGYQAGMGSNAHGVRSTTVSAHTSPVNLVGPPTPTRPGLSPSYFLTNRSSPYRPVRNVNTLLIPPPSAAMQNSAKNISFEQMRYQPIGRPTEQRSGHVPYYQSEGWNQSNSSTPTTTLYRPF